MRRDARWTGARCDLPIPGRLPPLPQPPAAQACLHRDDQHGAGGLPEDLIGHASQEDPGQPSKPARSHDDAAGMDCVAYVYDFGCIHAGHKRKVNLLEVQTKSLGERLKPGLCVAAQATGLPLSPNHQPLWPVSTGTTSTGQGASRRT